MKKKEIKKETKKEEIKSNEPTKEILSLTKQLVDLDDRYEIASKEKAKLYDERKKLQYELIEKMETNNLESFRSSEFGLIYSYNKFWAKITDMELAEKWLLENGLHDEVLKLEARSARLNELIQKRLEDGLTVPPGIDYTLQKSIGRRAS